MSLTSNQQVMAKMYLAGFLRAPEKGGLDYWTSLLDGGQSLSSVGDTIFSLPIVQDIYTLSMSNADFVTAIYHNVFGKNPDDGGLNYWTGRMEQGEHRGDLVMSMINAGLGTPAGTEGKQYIENRLDACEYAIGQQLSAARELDVDALLARMAAVDDSAESLERCINDIDDLIAQSGSNPDDNGGESVKLADYPQASWLDATGGAYEFELDLNDVPGHSSRALTIDGFGADDTLTITHAMNGYPTVSGGAGTIQINAVGSATNIFSIALFDVNQGGAGVVGVPAFNALPIGDLTVI